jgi:nucleotide-binding universal stress UspA family protein
VSARVGQTVELFRSAGYAARAWIEPEFLGVPDDIKYAAELFAADLVVVGSRRMSELSAFLRGSVSRRVAHITDLPMLVVPTVHQTT